MYSIESFKKKVNMLHIELSDKQYNQYVTYYEMVVEKNKVMNLTGITEFDEFIDKHYIDSLSIVNAVDIHQVQSAIDVGTGAGFPGIPLKIAFPHLKITLLDSLNKRINFLNEVVEMLRHAMDVLKILAIEKSIVSSMIFAHRVQWLIYQH